MTDKAGEVSFPQVRPSPSLADQVAEHLFARVVDLPPGSELPSQKELADQFGVSRTVIREAVRSLAAKGVIDVRSGRKLQVAAVDASSVSESLTLFLRGAGATGYGAAHEVRAVLETHVAELAAERATPHDLEALHVSHEAMVDASDEPDTAAIHDVEFHRALARATQNPLFEVMLDSIGAVLLEVRRATLRVPTQYGLAVEAHAEILQAVDARDGQAARTAMRAHLDEVA